MVAFSKSQIGEPLLIFHTNQDTDLRPVGLIGCQSYFLGLLLTVFQQNWAVLPPSNAKWTYIYHENLKCQDLMF